MLSMGRRKRHRLPAGNHWLFIPEKPILRDSGSDTPWIAGKVDGNPWLWSLPKAPSLQTPTLGNRWVLPKKEKTGKH